MASIKNTAALLFCCFICSASFSQTADSAATVKLVARAWAPDSVSINNEIQDASKSAGAKIAFNKDFSITSTNPDGTEDHGSWKYDAASNSIIMKQGEDESATVTFKILSATDKSLALSMSAEGLEQSIKIYLSPAKE